jgi:hypothetical protein
MAWAQRWRRAGGGCSHCYHPHLLNFALLIEDMLSWPYVTQRSEVYGRVNCTVPMSFSRLLRKFSHPNLTQIASTNAESR